MQEFLSKWHIGPRLYAAFGGLIGLLVITAGVAIIANQQIKAVVEDFSGIASDTALVGKLQGSALTTRLHVKDFIISGDQKDIDRVRERLRNTQEFLETAMAEITKPSRAEKVRTIHLALDEYSAGFETVTELQSSRNQLVDKIHELGPDLRKKLSEVMRSAYNDRNVEAAFLAGVAQEKLLLARYYVERYLLKNDNGSAERARAEMAAAITSGEALSGALQNPNHRELAKAFQAGINAYATNFDEVFEVIVSRNDIIDNTLDRLGPVIAAASEAVQLDLNTDQTALSGQTVSTIAWVDLMLVIAALFSVGVGLTAAFAISKSIAVPVNAMTAIMRKLAEGDLQITVPAKDRGDEIGMMAETVEVFKQNAIARAEAEAAREVELAAKAKRSQTIERLVSDFDRNAKDLIAELASAGQQLDQSAGAMEGIARKGVENAERANSATDQAARSVQSVAAAATEMESTVAEIAQQMSHADSMTRGAFQDAEAAVGKVETLIENARSIERVVDLIGDIAEQTNLLALNATIEAARAGEAGRGFAVVAQEVKSLASQTAKATRDIESDIAAMRGVSSDATKSMGAVLASIQELTNVSSSIAAAMEEQSATTSEIAQSTNNAADGTNNAQSVISQLANDAQQVGSTSSDLANSASSIRERTQSMQQSIGAFLSSIRAA